MSSWGAREWKFLAYKMIVCVCVRDTGLQSAFHNFITHFFFLLSSFK